MSMTTRPRRAPGTRPAARCTSTRPGRCGATGHSTAGDLTPLFSGWFDPETGAKGEPASYWRIAGAIGRAPADILFLSDVVDELDAAREAGLALVDRRADYPKPRIGAVTHGRPRAESFTEIDPG
jgi:enolase-phosphatase E1